tara:strand:+ start:12054 stop:14099 length:2046 start_codon:yes stop_codon:yes gene_type:complete
MGLKQLLADLSGTPEFKSKSFGYNDHIDADSIYNPSNEPFITYGFDGENNIVGLSNPLLGKIDENLNYASEKAGELDDAAGDLIRGGTQLQLKRRYEDYERIDKYLRTPDGDAWLKQQVALQLSNPRVDAPMKGALDNLLAFGLSDNPPDPNQTEYNPLINSNKTLLQVGLSGLINSGQLAAREGLIPGVHFGYYNNFFKRGGAPRDSGMSNPSNNRLVHLGTNIGHMVEGEEGGGLLGSTFGALNNIAAKINKGLMWLGGGGEELYSYLGGPDSIYGIGTTIHRRWVNTTTDVKRGINWPSPGNVAKAQSEDERKKYSTDYKLVEGTIDERQINATGTGIQNYLKAIGKPGFWYDQRVNKKNNDSKTYHRESKYGLGNPGRKSTRGFGKLLKDGQLDYSIVTDDAVDKINQLSIKNSETITKSQENLPEDFINFRIEAVDSENILNSQIIMFRAFLDDFSDGYSAKHNTYNYNGRAEDLYTYDSFSRDISLGFKIAAQSRDEMRPLYTKLNYLVSNVAPDYNTKSGRIMTPFIKLTVGHYLNRVPGVLGNVSLSWKKEYPWEIVLDKDGRDQNMLQLPHVLDVSMKFKPVHDFMPKKSINDSPFILPAKDGGSINLKGPQKWLDPNYDETNKTYLNKQKEKQQYIDGKDFDPNNAVQTATGIWQNKSEVATQKAKVTNAE